MDPAEKTIAWRPTDVHGAPISRRLPKRAGTKRRSVKSQNKEEEPEHKMRFSFALLVVALRPKGYRPKGYRALPGGAPAGKGSVQMG